MGFFKSITDYFKITSPIGDYDAFAREADKAIDASSGGVPGMTGGALKIAVVHSCIKVISETLSVFPMHLMKKNGLTFIKDEDSDFNYLLGLAPNPRQTPQEWLEEAAIFMLIKGKNYSQLIRNHNGDVIQMVNLDPDRMDEGINEEGKPAYLYTTSNLQADGKTHEVIPFEDEDIMVVHGFMNMSPVSLSKQTFEMAAAEMEFGTKALKNGVKPSGIITRDRAWADKGDRKNFIASWKKAYAGATNAGKTILLEDGMKFQSMNVAAEDIAYIEGRKLSKEDICGIFRVPQSMVGKEAEGKYDSVQMKATSFIRFTMLPHIKRFEQAFQRSIIPRSDFGKVEVQFFVDELMRASRKERMEANKTAIMNTVNTPNEVRATENLPPMEGGDQLLVPLNMGIGLKREGSNETGV